MPRDRLWGRSGSRRDSYSHIEPPPSPPTAQGDNGSCRPSRPYRVGRPLTPFSLPSTHSPEGSPPGQMPKSTPLSLLFPYALTTSSSTICCLLNKGNLFLRPIPAHQNAN